MVNIQKLIEEANENGYQGDKASAKVCQDIVLKALSVGPLSRNVTIKGGVVMRSKTNNVRRATQDLDIDFIKYSLSKISNGVGKIVEKIPVISKSQLDENLIKAGKNLLEVNTNRTQSIIQVLADSQTDYISSFMENIHTIDALYNQPMHLMFDSENIYIAKQ